jgi:hypothetical protein
MRSGVFHYTPRMGGPISSFSGPFWPFLGPFCSIFKALKAPQVNGLGPMRFHVMGSKISPCKHVHSEGVLTPILGVFALTFHPSFPLILGDPWWLAPWDTIIMCLEVLGNVGPTWVHAKDALFGHIP